MTPGQREVPGGIPAGAPQDAEYWHSRWEAALERGDADALHIIRLRAERDAVVSALTRIRALHEEYEGRCTHCVEWCDCLDINTCTHGNVPWPCPTVAALPPVDSPEDTNG